MNEFTEVASLTEIISNANAYVGTSPHILNFILQSKFNISILQDAAFLEEAELAHYFQTPIRPKHFYMNHGEYIKENGIQHLIDELKKKKDSNRALVSLINQTNIIESGDNPIPSFMTVQCRIEENNKLFFTIYFRALEVLKFLKINLEEIRLIINQIHNEINGIEEIYLTIIAFKAYKDENINPFIRPKLELLTESQLLKMLELKVKENLIPLLEEKISFKSTVIDDNAFKIIDRILNDNESNMGINTHLKSIFTKSIIKNIIENSDRLKILREKNSHGQSIDTLYSEYKMNIQRLIDEIQKIDS